MEELDFNRMIYAIVSGLYEKEQSTDKYPFSEHLLYGMNLLAALAFRQNQTGILMNLHEESFISEYAAKPVKAWFEGWSTDFLAQVSSYDLYKTGPLVLLHGKNFEITEECADLYSNTEADLFSALEQNQIYRMMKELPPEQYTAVRKFIVEHPVCTEKELRAFKIRRNEPEIWAIINTAYEDIPENSFHCPECGWTMTFHGIQAYCCNQSCTKGDLSAAKLKPLDPTEYKRVIHGVMRYMCLPGKLELEIQAQAEQYGCKTVLWPENDRYDIQITLENGETWAIDAKTHRNPYTLASAIKTDNCFATVAANRRFYVIPAERLESTPAYCDICNTALKEKGPVCITDQELYQRLRKEQENVSI